MRKCIGEQYDPAIRNTEHGARLYNFWRKIRKSPHVKEWDHFLTFYNWAVHSGYTLGAWLRQIDDSKPYAPDNCTWYIAADSNRHINMSWADEWNKAVNRIRKHYGMPPLEGTSYDDV